MVSLTEAKLSELLLPGRTSLDKREFPGYRCATGWGMAKLDQGNAVRWPRFGSVSASSLDAGNLASAVSTLLLGLLAAFTVANAVWFALLDRLPGVPCLVSGIALVLIGTRLILQALTAFRNSGTNVLPYKPSLALVTGGIFGRTRNPMYQGMGIVVLGPRFSLAKRRSDGASAPGGAGHPLWAGPA
jgi:hypothetical protein